MSFGSEIATEVGRQLLVRLVIIGVVLLGLGYLVGRLTL